MVTWSPDDNPSHPRHPNTEGRHHTSQIGYHGNQAQNLLYFWNNKLFLLAGKAIKN